MVSYLSTHLVSNAQSQSIEEVGIDEERQKNTLVRKGLLWLQRDKLFSRWKERYVIVTTDYLQCFKKASSRITEMGPFLFKVKYFGRFSKLNHFHLTHNDILR